MYFTHHDVLFFIINFHRLYLCSLTQSIQYTCCLVLIISYFHYKVVIHYTSASKSTYTSTFLLTFFASYLRDKQSIFITSNNYCMEVKIYFHERGKKKNCVTLRHIHEIFSHKNIYNIYMYINK